MNKRPNAIKQTRERAHQQLNKSKTGKSKLAKSNAAGALLRPVRPGSATGPVEALAGTVQLQAQVQALRGEAADLKKYIEGGELVRQLLSAQRQAAGTPPAPARAPTQRPSPPPAAPAARPSRKEASSMESVEGVQVIVSSLQQ